MHSSSSTRRCCFESVRRRRSSVNQRGIPTPIGLGRIASFAEIARRKGQGERHIRLLAPLAFVSPRIIAAVVDGTAPADSSNKSVSKPADFMPKSRVTRDTRLCKPVTVTYRTGLGQAETEIGKWRAETAAAKPPVQT